MSNVDDILAKMARVLADDFGTQPNDQALLDRYKADFKALMLELIGDNDRTHGEMGQFERIERIAKNELRAELRQKVEAL